MKQILIILFLCPIQLIGQLQLAEIFSDNMVLQRNKPLKIWGKAVPGKKVIVQLGTKVKKTVAKQDASWTVLFPPQRSNSEPQTITVRSGVEGIILKNILIGDVWIASGQSNMEWPMRKEMHWKDERKNTNQPLIRLNNPTPAGRYVYGEAYTDSLNRRLSKDSFYLWHGWRVCDSSSVAEMSAVAYYFARSIVASENIPVGIINLAIGGAPIETFISKEAFQTSKRFNVKVKGNWLENKQLPEWIRERARQNIGSNVHGLKDSLGFNHAYKPGFAYESGIKPLLNFKITGMLWYQGESNSLEGARVAEYKDLMHLLIDSYRTAWNQAVMPFYWVQLSSIDSTNYQSQFWPQFRDEQRKLLHEIKGGGMAVSSDAGFKNDVHPTNKKLIGERLARWALKNEYGRNILASGPLPLSARFENDQVVIQFEYTGTLLKTTDGKSVKGFSLDGVSEVDANIVGTTVVIKTKEKPSHLYFGWKPYSDANLENAEGLPASTFKIPVK